MKNVDSDQLAAWDFKHKSLNNSFEVILIKYHQSIFYLARIVLKFEPGNGGAKYTWDRLKWVTLTKKHAVPQHGTRQTHISIKVV